MDNKQFIEETRADVEQLLLDQNAELGVLLKIVLQGADRPGVSDEEVFEVLNDLADSLIMKSPEAALQFRKDVEAELEKDKNGLV